MALPAQRGITHTTGTRQVSKVDATHLFDNTLDFDNSLRDDGLLNFDNALYNAVDGHLPAPPLPTVCEPEEKDEEGGGENVRHNRQLAHLC